VLPQHKGTGLAAQLLNAIETWLQEHGCTWITLGTTPPLEAAVKFYQKHGYVGSGRVSDFFGMPLLEYVKHLD
jgi:GNAT superfamily N-acetyltransferase